MSTTGNAPVSQEVHPLSTRVAIEALGSFVIVLAGLATAIFSASPATVAFSYGLALIAVLIAFGNITTGYFNPAISLGMAVAGRIKWFAAILFMVAQTIGAFAAALVLYAVIKVIPAGASGGVAKVFTTLANGFDSHSPLSVPMIGVLIVEVVLSAVLVAVVLGATSPSNKSVLAPLAIGVALIVGMIVTVPISNGSLNPARSTAVVFLSDSWAVGQLWLFWLAPLFGAALAAAIYRTFTPLAPENLKNDAELPSVAEAESAELPQSELVENKVSPEAASAEVPENDAMSPRTSDAQEFFDSPKQ